MTINSKPDKCKYFLHGQEIRNTFRSWYAKACEEEHFRVTPIAIALQDISLKGAGFTGAGFNRQQREGTPVKTFSFKATICM